MRMSTYIHHHLLFHTCIFPKAKEEIFKDPWSYLHGQIMHAGINRTGCCEISNPIVQQCSFTRQRVDTHTSRGTHNDKSKRIYTSKTPQMPLEITPPSCRQTLTCKSDTLSDTQAYTHTVSFTDTHVSGSEVTQCTGCKAHGQKDPCSHSWCSFGSTPEGQAQPGSMQVQQPEGMQKNINSYCPSRL